jgi:Transcriptional regulator
VTHKSLTTEKEIIKNANQIKIIVFKLGCSYRQRLEMVLSQWGIINYSILEFGSLEGIINCVASGVGISILPRAVVQLYKNKSMVAHKIPKSIALVKTIFIRRKENLPRNLDLFSKMIKVQLKTGKRR